ncbi:hypothetical protein KY284_030074 [Solanum tuberosum]|nr:hypothetical protein KY284_030074 [Solanum tuberosum]
MLFSSSPEQRSTEKGARRSELVLAMLLAGAAFACWLGARVGDGAWLPAGFRSCSLTGADRCSADRR